MPASCCGPAATRFWRTWLASADLARTYEATGGVSFRGFVEELTAQAEKEEASEAPVLEEDSDGVRLMTVHGAKGLEFPVVILADLTANLCAREPDQYVDANKRVSATRLLRCAPWELLDHEADEALIENARKVSAWPTWPRRARATSRRPGRAAMSRFRRTIG